MTLEKKPLTNLINMVIVATKGLRKWRTKVQGEGAIEE